MSGLAFARLLKTQPTVISEAVNLDGQMINEPLVCHRCTFEKSITAVGATFKRTVDFSGSTFLRDVDMSQATFLAPAVFGPGGPNRRPKGVKPPEPCGGDGTWFLGGTNFELATFDGPAIFQAAVFKGPEHFDFAGFNGEAVFAQGCSLGTASFMRAVFGDVADFGAYSFQGGPNFVSAEFRGRADFSQATFAAGATFTTARFVQGATFEAANFQPTSKGPNDPTENTYFNYAIAGGALDFSSATFLGFASYSFSGLRVSGDLSFAGATIKTKCPSPSRDANNSTHCLAFGYADNPPNPFSATTFELGVNPTLRAVDVPERAAILQRIESSAKAAGDLGLANNAHYELQVISSQSDCAPLDFLDFVFYRWIAGYLVRPLQPLAALLALAALITLVRERPRAEREKNPPRSGIGRHVHEAGIRLGTGYAKSLSLVGRGKSITEPRPWKSVEAVLYRLLLVCVLIGLANSNPTLRQMVDAVH